MKKIALFVEGQTEQIFIKKLIEQLVTPSKVTVNTRKLTGGKKSSRKIIFLTTQPPSISTDYYFEIYDCGNDSKVKDDIIENLPSLQKNGFSMIIGLRDVYPYKIADLRKYLFVGLPQGSIPTHIVLAVNEVEGWFLAEENHYFKIDKRLTLTAVNTIAKIDVSKDSTEIIPHPSETLQCIYNTVNVGYTKRKQQVNRVVNALDYVNLYVNVGQRNNSFSELLTHLDSIFS
jgi:hypothetical protein